MTSHERESRFRRLVPFVEPLAVMLIGLGITFFADPATHPSALTVGAITSVLGALFGLNRFIQQDMHSRDLKRQSDDIVNTLSPLSTQVLTDLESLNRLARLIGLERETDSANLRSLIESYARISDSVFLSVKEQLVLECTEKLRSIADNKRSEELSTGPYYRWLFQILSGVRAPDDSVFALSMMLEIEWDDSRHEEEFFRLMVAACERGVPIERVFIVKRERLGEALLNPNVRAHCSDVAPSLLRGYVAYEDYLLKRDKSLLDRAGEGFFAVSSSSGIVALVDAHTSSGEVRGWVSRNRGDAERLSRLYTELKHGSYEMRTDMSDLE